MVRVGKVTGVAYPGKRPSVLDARQTAGFDWPLVRTLTAYQVSKTSRGVAPGTRRRPHWMLCRTARGRLPTGLDRSAHGEVDQFAGRRSPASCARGFDSLSSSLLGGPVQGPDQH